MYKPKDLSFDTPIRVRNCTISTINGAPDVSYQDANPALDFCLWKGMGGTESIEDGAQIIEDTAQVTMWYRPDINEQTVLLLDEQPDKVYLITNLEDVEQRHMWLILKVKRMIMMLYDEVVQIRKPLDAWGNKNVDADAPRLPCRIAPDRLFFAYDADVKVNDRFQYQQPDGTKKTYTAKEITLHRDSYGHILNKVVVL